MNAITIRLKLFGAFKDQTAQEEISVQIPQGSSVTELRKVLSTDFGNLVFDSALADEARILPEDTKFQTDSLLAILPPICGG